MQLAMDLDYINKKFTVLQVIEHVLSLKKIKYNYNFKLKPHKSISLVGLNRN